MGAISGERASATNSGPSADPPIPTESTSVNLFTVGGLMIPVCTFSTKVSMSLRVSVISLPISGDGESSGFLSQ